MIGTKITKEMALEGLGPQDQWEREALEHEEETKRPYKEAPKLDPLNPKAWCGCCGGTGEAQETVYMSNPQKSEVVYTGKIKPCPGCFGTKISARAKKWREDNPNEAASSQA